MFTYIYTYIHINVSEIAPYDLALRRRTGGRTPGCPRAPGAQTTWRSRPCYASIADR